MNIHFFFFLDTSQELKDTQQLFYVFQLTQIVRLFLEANLRKSGTANSFDKVMRTPVFNMEDQHQLVSMVSNGSTSSRDDSSVIDQDSPLDPMIQASSVDTSGSNSIPLSKESNPTSSQKKLRRSPEFKIKNDEKHASSQDTPVGLTALNGGYHIRKKDGFYPVDGDEDEIFSSHEEDDETGYVSLQEEHFTLQQMYTKAIQENEKLKDANAFMQKKLSSIVNLKHTEMFGSSFSSGGGVNPDLLEKQDIFNKFYYEDMSFDQLNDLTNNSFEISTGQQSVYNHAKDLSSLQRNKTLLEEENQNLLRERNDSRIKLRDLEKLIRENTEKCRILETQVKTIENSNTTLIDQVVYLCSTLDIVRHMETTHRLPAIKDELSILESELYMMIDQNVRYESALMEIKFKVTKYKEKIMIETSSPSKSPENLQTNTGSVSTAPESPASVSKNAGSKVKRSISARASSSRSSSPLVKKASEIKKERRETVKMLRKENNDRPATLAKEIKTCRATRMKELLQERLLMTQRITSLEKEMLTKDEELQKKSLHVELLTQEVGQIDLESMGVGNSTSSPQPPTHGNRVLLERSSTFVKDQIDVKAVPGKNCVDISLPVGEDDDIEIIEIPEVKYDDLMAFVQNKKRSDLSSPFGPQIDSFDGNHSSSHNNTRLVEREFKTRVVSLERTNECLRESNCALLEELRLVKSTSRDQREKIKALTMEIARINSEADALKYQHKLSQSGFENSRLKYEKQISMIRKQIAQANQEHQMVTKKRIKNSPVSQATGWSMKLVATVFFDLILQFYEDNLFINFRQFLYILFF